MKLSKKIFLFLFGLTLLASGINYLASTTIKNTQNDMNTILDKDLYFLSKTKEIYTQGLQRGQAVRNVILNPQDKNAEENFHKAASASLDIFDEILPMASSFGLEKPLSTLKNLTDTDIEIQKEAIKVAESNQQAALTLIVDKETPVWREIKKEFFEAEKVILDDFDTEQNETNKKIDSNITIILILLLSFIIVAVALFIYMRKTISVPISNLSGEVDRLADGDLTIEPMKAKTKDEIGILITAFNKMVDDLREIVTQVKNSSENVASSAEELMAGAEQTNKATEHIASTMEQLAAGTEQQVSSVKETHMIINDMADGLVDISARAKHVSGSAYETLEKSTAGKETINSVNHQMNDIHQNVNRLAELLKGLGDRSQEIGKITEFITGIADQTNLLALNAAIEAARAGDNGRGFAVVADEVRKLAEQSSSSAQQISDLVSYIQAETQQAVVSMSSVTSDVVTGINVVNEAGQSFNQIEQSVNDVTKQIREVSNSVDELSSGVEKIILSMDTVANIVEESSAGSQSISAATEEQLASMQEISASSSDLANMAEDLTSTIGKFKV